MKAYFVQYYRYARGDGKANLWWRRHAIRYATYFGLIPALGWSVRRNWLALLVGIALSLVYLRRPLERAWVQSRGLDTWDRFGVLGLVPFIRLVGDVAKMVGYPAGLLWRIRSQRKF
jgi:hypothetical protein